MILTAKLSFFFQFIKKNAEKFARKEYYVYFCTRIKTKTRLYEVYV